MKRLNFVIRLLSTIMSGYCFGSMLYALITYYNTKNKMLSNGQHPWSPDTVLWPTYLVLATAALTLLMNTITMCLYFKGSAAADRSDSISGYIEIALAGANAVVWAVNAGLFKMANTGNDLWGWSCSPAADALKDEVNGILNFNSLCQVQVGICHFCLPHPKGDANEWIQTGTWIMTIAKTAMYLIMLGIYIVMLSLWIKGRRMMKRKEQLLSMQMY